LFRYKILRAYGCGLAALCGSWLLTGAVIRCRLMDRSVPVDKKSPTGVGHITEDTVIRKRSPLVVEV